MAYRLIGAQLAFSLADAMEDYLQDLAGKAIWSHPVVSLTKGVPVTILPTIWGDISFERLIDIPDREIAILMNGTSPKRAYSTYVIFASPGMLKDNPELKAAWQDLGTIKNEKSEKRGVYSVYPQTSIISGLHNVAGYTQKQYLQVMDALHLMLLPGALADLKACMDPTRAGYPAFPKELKDYMGTPNKVGALPITQTKIKHAGKESLLLRVTIDHLLSEFFVCPIVPLRYEQAPELALLLRCLLKYNSLEAITAEILRMDPTLESSFLAWIETALKGFEGIGELMKSLPEDVSKILLPSLVKIGKVKGLAEKYGWTAAHLLARESQALIDGSSMLTGLFYDPNNFIGVDNVLSRVKRTKYSVL